MFPVELVECAEGSLPTAAGVVAVRCPKGRDRYELIDAKECEDIRATVAEKAQGWASHCKEFLTFWIFVSDDRDRRRQVLERVED